LGDAMARTVKKDEYNAKRNEILDVAMRLIYSKGYEQMTIQDILDELQISRGALYHYFDSKQAMLEAFIARSVREAGQALFSVVHDPNLTAIQKIQGYFDLSTQWKTARKELFLGIMQSWYSDENARIRQKMLTQSLRYMPRVLEPIIHQGVEEKVFATPYPAEVAVLFVGFTLSLSDVLVDLMLAPDPEQGSVKQAQTYLDAYFDSIERMLGAPAGSFKVLDAGVFKDWFGVLKGVTP
jgi:TetR/AcrR family transcriptional regulator, transcriptional repressor for nem operon